MDCAAAGVARIVISEFLSSESCPLSYAGVPRFVKLSEDGDFARIQLTTLEHWHQHSHLASTVAVV